MKEKLPCRAIVFDFDGTLANSMPFLQRIGVEVIRKYYGIEKEEATGKYKETTGLPFEHQIEINFPNNQRNNEAVEEFEKLKIQRIYEQQLFPDTVRTLFEIKRKGIEIFVSSSTFQPTIEEYFKRRGLAELFRGVLGYRPNFEKGADHFNSIRNDFGIDLSGVVFVGDSIKDYERSKGYCQFIALAIMFTEQQFREAGHSGHVVNELSQVPPLLQPI